jgi:transcriptional regulator with XRE-family HTH domain
MTALLTPDDIKRLAADRGVSIASVCIKAGIATSTFSRWQAGDTEPTLTVYRRLVAAAKGEPVDEMPPSRPKRRAASAQPERAA